MGDLSMDSIVKVLLVTAIFFLTADSAVNAISCFQCNSVKDPGCDIITDNSTDNVYYKECQPTKEINKSSFFCRTVTLTLKELGNRHQRVVRSCGWERYRRDCYQFEDDDHKEVVCQCFTDGCNSKASPGVLKTTLLAAVAVIPLLVTLYLH